MPLSVMGYTKERVSALLLLRGRQYVGLVVGELEVLLGLLDGECGPLLLEVEVASVARELVGVNVDKVDLALELLGDALDRGAVGLALLVAGDKEVGERDAAVGILGVVVWADVVHGGDRVRLDKVGNGERVKVAREDDLALVKGLVQDNLVARDTLLRGDSGIDDGGKRIVVLVLFKAGQLICSFCFFFFCLYLLGNELKVLVLGRRERVQEGNDDDLVRVDKVAKGLGVELGDGGLVEPERVIAINSKQDVSCISYLAR